MAGEVQQGFARAASVLAAIGGSASGSMRGSDIARATGLGPSTITRLLATLTELGYVAKEPDGAGYAIGTTVLRLASEGLNQSPVYRQSRAIAQELAHRTGFSANVATRDGDQLIYLSHFEGAHARKDHSMVGMGQPLHASALGKCLLIGTDDAERRELLGDLPAYTEHTIASHDALTQEIARVVRKGSALEDQELALGRVCVAAPIRGAHGGVVAAISVSGRLSLMREAGLDALTEDVIEAADRISVGLGLITAIAPRSAS
ncbi:IclR family transcriptional regulator [Microbacterium halophytorum]|uniref:IclR family transcriptional regulator n=1 Tax=Microbacterium halophytorum TaxID=2067568 RepID=UPI000CFB0C35|nr:IclR family transcriptional regulator [Microbacterium halophytorum]